MQYERLSHYRAHGKRWVQITAEPTFGADGKPDGWVAVVSDIHDHKLAEEALREADRRKDDFLAMLAHELRNPLAPIRNAVAILGKKDQIDPEVAWSREVIERQVDAAARLVDDLLDIGRISRGRARAAQGARRARARGRHGAGDQPPAHQRRRPPPVGDPAGASAAVLDADPARLAQVFSNLLNNAAQATRRRGARSA